MKNIFYACFAVLLLLTGCDKPADNADKTVVAAQNASDTRREPEKFYFFYAESCIHCHDASKYIKETYPDLELTMVDVGTPEGYDLLVSSARRLNLGNRVGTPLFVLGDKHLMGWAPEYAKDFDLLVKEFQAQQAAK